MHSKGILERGTLPKFNTIRANIFGRLVSPGSWYLMFVLKNMLR
jgi:hypothetical protein